MLYIGADIHKKTTTMAVKNAQGDVLLHKKLPNDKIVLRQFVKSIDGEKKLTAEATFNWYWFIDLMEKYVDEKVGTCSYLIWCCWQSFKSSLAFSTAYP